jgi:hypothetical protein
MKQIHKESAQREIKFISMPSVAINIRPIAVCVLAFLLASSVDADENEIRQAEMKWARGVASDFLSATKRQDSANVESLLTPEYAKLLKERTAFYPEPAEAVYERTKTFEKWTITTGELSPDRDEALFKGEIESSTGTREFALRVVKDKPANRWRVGFLSVEEEKPHPKKKVEMK